MASAKTPTRGVGGSGSARKKSKFGLPPAQFLGWTSAGTQIWARLKMAGLEVSEEGAVDLVCNIFGLEACVALSIAAL